MPILTKEVEVRLWGSNVKHYQSLGYQGKHGDVIKVKIKDLSDGCNASIQYLCDYCEKEILTMIYADFTRRTKEVNKMACKKCYGQKVKETTKLRYGVEHYAQTQECKEKKHNTCVEKYGEDYRQQFMTKAFETFYEKTGYNFPSQSPEVKQKMIQSCINHFGVESPQLSLEVRKKTENTNMQKYGHVAPSQNAEVQKKACITNMQRYGVPYTMQSIEVRIKATESLCKNNKKETSKQQYYLHNLYGGELNYPVSYYAIDICFPEEKLCIEYDGGGHNLGVILGELTQEEFNRKEIIRSNIIKNEGYKLIKIISTKDFLPPDEILFQMLEYAKQYFSNYPNHSWIEFNIDSSIVRNAEQKDGVFFDYGELRKIKKSDVGHTDCA